MARVLAFDYGTKRIGVAVTDPLQIIATGLNTIHRKDIVEFLKKYLLKMAASTIAQSGFKKSDHQIKERVDTISATIILQAFLEKKIYLL